MTINEAIKDLQARVDGEFCIKGQDNCEDMKLGIEALKRVKNTRDKRFPVMGEDLPGETKE